MIAQLLGRLTAALPRGPEGLVWWLVLVQSLGITAVLPVLPLYASEQGADLHFVGLMVGAYMATSLVCQYPAGWLSDRFGRRGLMFAGLAAYALASLGFLVFRSPEAFVVLRGIEGIAGACFTPAALAYVADRAPEGERGRRLAHLTVAQNGGMLVGPAIGGALASLCGLASPFVALAVLCLGGALLTARLPGAGRAAARERHREQAMSGAGWAEVRWALFTGLAARALAGGFAMGLYESVWALYLKDLGASTWLISMSWTAFALPAIVLAGVAGRLIDSTGPARLVVWGTLFSSLLVASYAMTERIEVVLFLSVIDGIGFAFAYPAQNALTMLVSPEALRGRVIGLVAGISTLGALVGAVLTPPLLGRGPVWCFGAGGAVLFASGLVLAAAVSIEGKKTRLSPQAQ
ncbi:MAG TPA: MFS transporter [Pantanalinema sp.]